MTLQFIPLFLGNIRGWEWIIILVIILLLFGGKKIPELMKGVGKGVASFKDGLNEVKKEIEDDSKPDSDKKK
ncbi:MAG: twin-arginine translocase TatA/TatE family subunit [Muribaculaceae bacterium]|nr:twin-arginine translocase TatA/TatE family subunit [Muribaculaceae bacterium]